MQHTSGVRSAILLNKLKLGINGIISCTEEFFLGMNDLLFNRLSDLLDNWTQLDLEKDQTADAKPCSTNEKLTNTVKSERYSLFTYCVCSCL